jgi:coproporphyrinogen III oxidase
MDSPPVDAAAVREYLLGLQARIVAAFEQEGGDAFLVDAWQREPGGALEGDGISRLVEGGRLLERGGCGFSHVKGKSLPAAATQHRAAELANAPFEAMGVSLVFHPRNPVRADGAHERPHARRACRRTARRWSGSAAAWT